MTPAIASSNAVPATATTTWLSPQRTLPTAPASTGSARPSVSSARSRNVADTA